MRILRKPGRNWLLLTAGVVLFGLIGMAPAAAKSLRLLPVDETSSNPEFAAYHAALLAAVRRRDAAFVVAQADSEIKLSFGGDYGSESFHRALTGTNEWQGEVYWRELQTVLELGGVFMGDGAFCTPYLSCIEVPGCPQCDPYETVFVTRKDAVARTEPNEQAPMAAQFSWDVLQIDNDAPGAQGWYAVKLPIGRTVFLSIKDSRMAIDYRARFEKAAAGWRMTVFIAGD